MAHARLLIASFLTAGSLFTITGCTSRSVWESEFQRGDVAAAPLSHTAPIKIREVPWDRVNQTLVEINEKLAKSDTHYDDWSPDQKDQLKAQMLRGLQVSTPVQHVDILGRSAFRTTDRLRPGDGELERFARKLGATTVIITSSYLGKTETIRQEAITEYRTGTISRNSSDNSKRRDSTISESSTVWVPMQVHADENAYIAFFLCEK